MGRDTSAFQDILQRCKRIRVIDLTLGDGTPLHYGSGDITLGLIQYNAGLVESDPLKISLTDAADYVTLRLSNLDRELGRLVTGETDALERAEVAYGIVVIDPITGDTFYDQMFFGEVQTAPVDETQQPPAVVLDVASDVEAAPPVQGRLVSEVFAFIGAGPAQLTGDPNDLAPPSGGGSASGGGGSGVPVGFGGTGRYPRPHMDLPL